MGRDERLKTALEQKWPKYVAQEFFRKYGGYNTSFNDLLSIANTALVRAADDYDPRKSKFETHANNRMRWLLMDDIKRKARYRELTGEILSGDLSRTLGEEDKDIETDILGLVSKTDLRIAIDSLPRNYGLAIRAEMTGMRKELAARLNCTEANVSYLYQCGLKLLREKLVS